MGRPDAIVFCQACDASLSVEAKYCGHCGTVTRDHKRKLTRAFQAKGVTDQRRNKALMSVFLGVLVAIAAAYVSGESYGFSALGREAVLTGGQILAGLLAIYFLRGRAFRQSFGRRPGTVDLLLGMLLPAFTLAIGYGYHALLFQGPFQGPFQGEVQVSPEEVPGTTALAWSILIWAVQPALFEEWLCRGILWITVRPVASRWTTIFVTATLFACLHGLNGGFLLELPHRFVIGLGLGWLRAHSGSLWPCILAHFVHNTAALLIG